MKPDSRQLITALKESLIVYLIRIANQIEKKTVMKNNKQFTVTLFSK